MQETKPKRKLKNISFEQEGAHIALCSKEQGVANQADYALVLRNKMFSEEFVQKLQQVKVTMEFPEFLTRFFGMYYDDAEVLAKLLGYVEPEDEEDEEISSWETYIQTKLQAFEIIKSANEGNYTEVLSALNEEQYLSILQDQEILEKALNKHEQIKKEELAKQEAERKKPRLKKSTAKLAAEVRPHNIVDEVSVGGTTPVVENLNKEQSMTNKADVKTVEQVVEVEMIAKSELDIIQKSLQEQSEQLQKALESVAKYEQEKKEQIAKSRKEALVAACGDKAEVLFKAVADVEEQVFADVVKALADMQAQIEKGALFQETGASVEETVDTESAVTKLIKAKFQKKSGE